MPLLALPPSADGRAVTGGAAVLRNHSTSSVTRDSTSFTSFSSTSSSTSSSVPSAAAYSSRCRRHRTDRRRLAAVLLTVVLLVAQASVAGGLAADADRKSRRKPSPPVVESSFGAEVDRGGGDVADTSIGKRLAAGNGRNVDGGDPSTWRNSSSSHAVNAATMATTAVSTSTARWNDEDRFVNPKPADLTIECKQLRSKRYISDGFCTSVKPVVDVVCTGSCLPIRQLPWYAEFIKVWSHAKTLQYRCVDDDVRRRDVLFACDNGETRSYKIRVVRSCKCKRYVHNQNESPASSSSSRKKKKNRKSRRSASAKRRNAAYGEDDNDEDDPETPAMRGRWSDDESNDRRDGDDN